MTEGEGFQGVSWTVQCEILQQVLLGCLPVDDDLIPENNQIQGVMPFDFFEFG